MKLHFKTPLLRARAQQLFRELSDDAGYTLSELLVVLAILSLLTAIIAPQVIGYLDRAQTRAAGIQISRLEPAIELFYLDVGRYPTTEEGLAALVEQPSGVESWAGPYVRGVQQIEDPWGRIYNYNQPGETQPFDIYTLGADGEEGGTGANQDVSSDER